MSDDATILAKVEQARANMRPIRDEELREIRRAAGLSADESDPRVVLNLLRAGGASLVATFETALGMGPASLDLVQDLLCAAEPVAPVPLVVVEALRRFRPDHPVARLVAEPVAFFVFDAMSDGESVSCPLPPRGAGPGPVVLLDFDAPFARWAEGYAIVQDDRLLIHLGVAGGLETNRVILAPLIVFRESSREGSSSLTGAR